MLICSFYTKNAGRRKKKPTATRGFAPGPRAATTGFPQSLPGRGKAQPSSDFGGKDYGIVLTRRKPKTLLRPDGEYLLRPAERQLLA